MTDGYIQIYHDSCCIILDIWWYNRNLENIDIGFLHNYNLNSDRTYSYSFIGERRKKQKIIALWEQY